MDVVFLEAGSRAGVLDLTPTPHQPAHVVELLTNLREVSQCPKEAPTWSFFVLLVLMSVSTSKNLLIILNSHPSVIIFADKCPNFKSAYCV